MKKYAQVTIKNDDGFIEYKIDDVDFVGFWGTKNVKVKFPNGIKETVIVEGKYTQIGLVDSNNSYTSSSTIYNVIYEVNGITIKLPLENFQVKIKDLLGESNDTK